MKYVLVLQWNTGSTMNYDLLVSCEDALIATLGSMAEVDGHDLGVSEMNIFIHSNQPEATFQRVKPVLQEMDVYDDLRAAYRHLEMGAYTILFPKTLSEFAVL